MASSVDVGFLHPGAMGAALAAALAGVETSWASEGRSAATRARASAAAIRDRGTVRNLVAACDVLVSICPPEFAEDVAITVSAYRFGGVYVEANAISPAAFGRIAEILDGPVDTVVDASVIGPPPVEPGSTRLYLAGAQAQRIADLFDGSTCAAVV